MKEVNKPRKEKMTNRIKTWWNIIVGSNFSLHRYFNKHKAVAQIAFIDGRSEYGETIRVNVNGTEYFFEGEEKWEFFKNSEGKQVRIKRLKYGGWGRSLMTKESNE